MQTNLPADNCISIWLKCVDKLWGPPSARLRTLDSCDSSSDIRQNAQQTNTNMLTRHILTSVKPSYHVGLGKLCRITQMLLPRWRSLSVELKTTKQQSYKKKHTTCVNKSSAIVWLQQQHIAFAVQKPRTWSRQIITIYVNCASRFHK